MKARVITALLIAGLSVNTYSAKSVDNQQNGSHVLSLAGSDGASLYEPIVFYKGSLTKFFQRTFNNPAYAHDVLSHDFSHFIQCLDYTQRRFDDFAHGRHVIRLFTHKLRSCAYVSAGAFDVMLDEAMPIMQRYLEGARQKVLILMKTSINDTLYDAFLGGFRQFRESPENFLAALSDELALTVYDHHKLSKDATIDDFVADFTLFLDLALGKLLWLPADGIKTWHLMTRVAGKLTRMATSFVWSHERLQPLHDALFERYCFFIDLVAQDLPSSFFSELGSDPALGTSELLCAEPLEPCLETRKQRLSRVLCQAEFKARAGERGIFTR